MISEIEKKIIAAIGGDISITSRPYKKIAEELGLTESKVIETLKDLCQKGVIRRFGATLKHQKSGFSANAMIAWKIKPEYIDIAGKRFAEFHEVTHCYCRPSCKEWPFNIYTMIHAKDEKSCYDLALEMSLTVEFEKYELLFSRKELKKTSMKYFSV